jgi:Uma2 family endonuclease
MSDAAKKILNEDEHYTYADYKAWDLDEGERYELIEGEAYAMSAPNDAHQAVSGEIFRQIANFLRGKPCKVRSAPYDVRLFYEEDESDDTVVQPDLVVLCDEEKRGYEGCRGAPDLVIEILSPSNTSEEYVRKFNLYLKAGVREYWVVTPKSKTVQVFILEPAAEPRSGEALLGNNSYRGVVYNGTAQVPVYVLPGLSVTLTDVFA